MIDIANRDSAMGAVAESASESDAMAVQAGRFSSLLLKTFVVRVLGIYSDGTLACTASTRNKGHR